jgi:hypothetical protein
MSASNLHSIALDLVLRFPEHCSLGRPTRNDGASFNPISRSPGFKSVEIIAFLSA